jgi:hypothetical protein
MPAQCSHWTPTLLSYRTCRMRLSHKEMVLFGILYGYANFQICRQSGICPSTITIAIIGTHQESSFRLSRMPECGDISGLIRAFHLRISTIESVTEMVMASATSR